MRDRRFGVEIEFDSGGLGTEGVASVLGNAFDKEGMRRWWFRRRMDYDGSEIELKTPILQGKKGFSQLKLVMNTLSNSGCFVTSDDGLHIHHDAPEYVNNIDNCIRLVKSWNQNRHLIYEFVAPERSEYDGDYWACPAWSENEISLLERNREIPSMNRHDLNLLPLRYTGSIEIRLHEGTLHYPEAESWIKFGQRLLASSTKHSLREANNSSHLLKKVRISKNAEMALIDKSKYRVGYRKDPSDEEYIGE